MLCFRVVIYVSIIRELRASRELLLPRQASVIEVGDRETMRSFRQVYFIFVGTLNFI